MQTLDHVLKTLNPELVGPIAKQKSIKLINIWKDRGMPRALKMAILKYLDWTVVLYCCETR